MGKYERLQVIDSSCSAWKSNDKGFDSFVHLMASHTKKVRSKTRTSESNRGRWAGSYATLFLIPKRFTMQPGWAASFCRRMCTFPPILSLHFAVHHLLRATVMRHVDTREESAHVVEYGRWLQVRPHGACLWRTRSALYCMNARTVKLEVGRMLSVERVGIFTRLVMCLSGMTLRSLVRTGSDSPEGCQWKSRSTGRRNFTQNSFYGPHTVEPKLCTLHRLLYL